MAHPFSIPQALNMKDVPIALKQSTNSRHPIDTAALPSMRLSLKPRPLPCNGTTGLMMSSIARRLQKAEPELKPNGVRCRVVHFPNDAVGDLSANLQQQAATLQHLRSARVIACLRAHSSNLAMDAARAALDGGLTVLEVTMNTPQAAEVIKVLVREYPLATIGAGTVLSIKEADLAKDAGAKFLMSPVTVEEIVLDHRIGPVVHIPGPTFGENYDTLLAGSMMQGITRQPHKPSHSIIPVHTV